ncbi:hypothetical protein, partial [Thiolapillus sp.]|uniref:hypothetical protein n=1 Tax=Thiolapillus sp. TaxID=2017437 RepID=UPI003AF79FE1
MLKTVWFNERQVLLAAPDLPEQEVRIEVACLEEADPAPAAFVPEQKQFNALIFKIFPLSLNVLPEIIQKL